MQTIKVSVIIFTGVHQMPLQRIEEMMLSQTMSLNEIEFILIEKENSTLFFDYFNSRKLHENIKVIKSNLTRAKAHNEGIRMSHGEVIYFLADDFIIPPTAVKAHYDFHNSNPELNYVGVSSGIVPKPLQTDFQLWLESTGRLFGVPFTETMTSVPEHFFYIGNTSVKRTFLNQVGLFDESFVGVSWEDYEMGLRLKKHGMKSIFVNNAVAEHYHKLKESERFDELEIAGENARYFKTKYAGDYPWEAVLKVPAWRYKMNKYLALLLFKITHKQAYQEQYWEFELNRRFQLGFFNTH